MNKATEAWSEILAVDELSDGDSLIHRLHPLAKFAATILYILLVVSFDKYNLSGLFVMILYPVILYRLSDISIGTCLHKMRHMLPLVMAVGIVNPFLDKVPMIRIGGLIITSGMISMVTLMLKGIFSILASFLLIATTKVDLLCASMRKIHVPELMITLFLLTYRYISVLIEQVAIMSDAYALRAPGQNGIHISGQLLLRSMDKARELYQSMLQRGFDGSFAYMSVPSFERNDTVFLAVSAVCLLTARFVDLAELMGGMVI